MTGNEARTVGIMRERRGQDAIGAAGVELDHETVGVTGHVGDLAGLGRLVEADAVGADLVEEREVVIGDAEFGEDVGSDVEETSMPFAWAQEVSSADSRLTDRDPPRPTASRRRCG